MTPLMRFLLFFSPSQRAVVTTPPVANFSAEETVYVGEANIEFTGTNGGGAATAYRWSWGDGSDDTTGSGEGAITSHFYSSSGEYTVSYTLYNAGGSDTETKVAYITVS